MDWSTREKLHTKSKEALGNDLFFQPFAAEHDKEQVNLGTFNGQGSLTMQYTDGDTSEPCLIHFQQWRACPTHFTFVQSSQLPVFPLNQGGQQGWQTSGRFLLAISSIILAFSLHMNYTEGLPPKRGTLLPSHMSLMTTSAQSSAVWRDKSIGTPGSYFT